MKKQLHQNDSTPSLLYEPTTNWPLCPKCGAPSKQVIVMPTVKSFQVVWDCCGLNGRVDTHPLLP